jgi:hypothetical protein
MREVDMGGARSTKQFVSNAWRNLMRKPKEKTAVEYRHRCDEYIDMCF